jgi:hypothetical protein
MFPKASVLPKSLAHTVPGGVVSMVLDVVDELDEELDESPPPPQAESIATKPKNNRIFILATASSKEIYLYLI